MLAACTFDQTGTRQSAVVATPAPDGIALSEAGAPILFYRSQPEPGREAWRVNYVHPLYSIAGTVITEDAPPDHLHQRGVYWAWRRIMVDGVRVADGWVGDKVVMAVAAPTSRAWPDGSMQIDAQATWRVPVAGVETAIIEESSTVRAYPLSDGQRRIVFEVRLRALRNGVQLAGTDDDKGYGGFSLRFAHSEQLEFLSDGQALQPLVAAVHTGEEVTLRWPAPIPGWPGSIPCQLPGERTALAKLGPATRAQHAELRVSGPRSRVRAARPVTSHRGRARALTDADSPAARCCDKNTHLIPVAAVIKSGNVTGVINRCTPTERCC